MENQFEKTSIMASLATIMIGAKDLDKRGRIELSNSIRNIAADRNTPANESVFLIDYAEYVSGLN